MGKKAKKTKRKAKKKTAVKKKAKGTGHHRKEPVKGDLGIEYVAIDTVRLNPKNPRRNEETTEDIIRSIKAFGVVWPILVRKNTNTIIAGNNRYRAFTEMGMKTIPVIFRTMDEIDADVLMVTDNKITEKTPWDFPKLADLFVEFDQMNVDMDLTGFTMDEIATIAPATFGPGEPDPKDDEVPDTPTKAKTKPGDLYIMGEHRLLCGDATKAEDVERLMDGRKAEWVWTDPPYGVNYTGGTGLTIQNDTPEGLESLLNGTFEVADTIMADGCPIYVAHPAGVLSATFAVTFIATGWRFHETLVWVKNSLVLGHSDYHYRHEPIIYGWKGKNRKWYAGRDQDTIFEVDRPSASPDHPTGKPVALITAQITNSSQKGDVGYDPFLGSGTTLIAAEKLGRICYGLEIEPKYCDVIVKRWEEYTGQKAKLKR